MKKVNVEKFLADYEVAVKEKEELVANKDLAIEAEKEKVEALEGFSAHVKEALLKEVIAEKETEFDLSKADEKIAGFEAYLEDIVEEEPVVEETAENAPAVDEFGNPVVG